MQLSPNQLLRQTMVTLGLDIDNLSKRTKIYPLKLKNILSEKSEIGRHEAVMIEGIIPKFSQFVKEYQRSKPEKPTPAKVKKPTTEERKVFNRNALVAEFHTSNAAMLALATLGYVAAEGKSYRWIGSAPTVELVAEVRTIATQTNNAARS